MIGLGLGQEAANVCGFAGMTCVVLAYAYGTFRAEPNPFIQHGVNLAGAALLALSLTVNYNPASMVLEGFWAAIAVWGLVKEARARSWPGNRDRGA